MKNLVMCDDRLAIHPGYYIEEYIKDNHITINDFAQKADLDTATVDQLIEAKLDVDKEKNGT